MPQRDTVAGEACDSSITSKIIDIWELVVTTSPDVKQSFLLSSRTCNSIKLIN